MSTNFDLVKLFNFIKENNKNLDPDHYQIAFHQKGLGVENVLKYIQGEPDKKVVIGKVGL